MSIYIDKTASVDPRAKIGDGVYIGPFSIIGPEVEIGEGTRIESHNVITDRVKIGRNNRIYSHCSIGTEPQDVSYKGGKTIVIIGDNNIFREHATVNRASEKEVGITSIGNNCYFMIGSHVAHDVRVGDNLIMANGACLAGHVHVGDNVTISGMAGVQQYVTVGSYSFLGGMCKPNHDVPPYMLVEGIPAKERCVNAIGLKRNNFPDEVIRALTQAYKLLFRSKVGLQNARDILAKKEIMFPAVENLLSFIEVQQQGTHGRGRDLRRKAA